TYEAKEQLRRLRSERRLLRLPAAAAAWATWPRTACLGAAGVVAAGSLVRAKGKKLRCRGVWVGPAPEGRCRGDFLARAAIRKASNRLRPTVEVDVIRRLQSEIGASQRKRLSFVKLQVSFQEIIKELGVPLSTPLRSFLAKHSAHFQLIVARGREQKLEEFVTSLELLTAAPGPEMAELKENETPTTATTATTTAATPTTPTENYSGRLLAELLLENGGSVSMQSFEQSCGTWKLDASRTLERYSTTVAARNGGKEIGLVSIHEGIAVCLKGRVAEQGGRMMVNQLGDYFQHLWELGLKCEPLPSEPESEHNGKDSARVPTISQFIAGCTEHLKLVRGFTTHEVELVADGGQIPERPAFNYDILDLIPGVDAIDAPEEQAWENSDTSSASDESRPATGWLSLLGQYSQWYSQRQAYVQPGALGSNKSPDDKQRLVAAFNRCIGARGFLTPDVVRAEIDHACRARKMTETELLLDLDVGPLLGGVAKMLLLVDATLMVCISTQVMLTLYDLERAILEHEVFKGKRRFEEACLGKLQFHPEVARRFQLDKLPGGIPKSFPEISSVEIAEELFSEPLLTSVGSRYSDIRARSFENSLRSLAKARGLEDFRMLGLYVQEASFLAQLIPGARFRNSEVQRRLYHHGGRAVSKALAEWVAIANPQAQTGFLDVLTQLSSPEAQKQFVERMQQPGDTSLKGGGDAEAAQRYVRKVFRALAREAGSETGEAREDEEEGADGRPADSNSDGQEDPSDVEADVASAAASSESPSRASRAARQELSRALLAQS
ncbi:unnamed protein product, partial [Polarella glacialis]